MVEEAVRGSKEEVENESEILRLDSVPVIRRYKEVAGMNRSEAIAKDTEILGDDIQGKACYKEPGKGLLGRAELGIGHAFLGLSLWGIAQQLESVNCFNGPKAHFFGASGLWPPALADVYNFYT